VCPEEVQTVYGEKPRTLNVMFPIEDVAPWEIIFPQYLKKYSSSRGLVCKGNGETAMLLNEKTGEMTEIECSPENCEEYCAKPPRCRQVAMLQFLLPDVPGLGVWQIDTSSFHSIINVNSGLATIKSAYGRISFVPLELSVVPKEVSPSGKKKNVYVLQLTSTHSLVQLSQMKQKGQQFALSAPSDDDVDTQEHFFPHTVPADEPVEEAEPVHNPKAESECAHAGKRLGFAPAKMRMIEKTHPDVYERLEFLRGLVVELDDQQKQRPQTKKTKPAPRTAENKAGRRERLF